VAETTRRRTAARGARPLPDRYRALDGALREAIGVAQGDTSFWGDYFDVDLAYDQAERGDFRGALRIIVDTLAPGIAPSGSAG
jgi:hypothetical protein